MIRKQKKVNIIKGGAGGEIKQLAQTPLHTMALASSLIVGTVLSEGLNCKTSELYAVWAAENTHKIAESAVSTAIK